MKKIIALLCLFMLGLSLAAEAQSTFTYRTAQGVNTGTAVKAPVKVATTAAITLSGAQMIDGVAVTDHLQDSTGLLPDRVLVKNQTDSTTNGIYSVNSSGAWARAPDMDGPFDVLHGTLVLVAGGNTQAGMWQLQTFDPITIGQGFSSLVFAEANFFANVPLPPLATGEIWIGNNSNAATAEIISGDCTLGTFGVIECLYSNGFPIITASSMATFTNKTFDSAGTGNTLKIGGITITGTQGTNSGNVALTGGSFINGNCRSTDSFGREIDAGGPCTTGGGGGTVASGVSGQLTYYSSSGSVVVGNPNLTISAGALTIGQAGTVAGNISLSGSNAGTTALASSVTGGGIWTFRSTTTDNVVGANTTDTLSNKTLVAPIIGAASGTSLKLTNTGTNPGGVAFYSPLAGQLQLSTTGSNGLTITATGSVGIGTTTPSFSLDVNGVARAAELLSTTTPIPVSSGGLGAATETQYGLLMGNGTNPVTAIADTATPGWVMTATSTAPAWQPSLMTALAVGSIIMAESTSNCTAGSTQSAANLTSMAAHDGALGGGSPFVVSGDSLTGNWQCLQSITASSAPGSGGSPFNNVGLWQRVN